MKKNIKTIWHIVKTLKDMPHKSGNYLMMTDMGWPLTFYWDAHARKCFILSNRNRYNGKTGEYDNMGKVDSVRMSLRNPTFIWTDIPGLCGPSGIPDCYASEQNN